VIAFDRGVAVGVERVSNSSCGGGNRVGLVVRKMLERGQPLLTPRKFALPRWLGGRAIIIWRTFPTQVVALPFPVSTRSRLVGITITPYQ
jgi:hypothetical protein